MQDFFKKHGVAVMTIRELFDFIVDPTITDDSVDSYLEEVCPLFLVQIFLINSERSLLSPFHLISHFRFSKRFWQEEICLWRMKLRTLCLCRFVD